jgi:Ser/Thr protein kinase RdoA (MazF antagonist)
MKEELSSNLFYEITPEKVLAAVEALGYRCTGRCLQLNSMENRVYEVEIDVDSYTSVSERFRVVKFYRPQRWTLKQIQEEHDFLLELDAQELNVIAPLRDGNGQTVHELQPGFYYAVWPRKGGRSNPEPSKVELETLGRLLGRIHGIGAARTACERLTLTPVSYGRSNLEYLLANDCITPDLRQAYKAAVEEVCSICEPWFLTAPVHRLHGDCHFGNVVWQDSQPYLLDFDDMVNGPAVQDVWLLVPGRDEEADANRDVLLQAYEQFKPFDWESLRLVEPLRALRYIHYSTWIARRREDPYFQRVFPHFGGQDYWRGQITDLHEQISCMHGVAW